MIGSGKLTRTVFSWRTMRWGVAPAVLVTALWACNSHPFEQPAPAPEAQTDKIYELNPLRQLDLIFVIDNSSSMEQEQENIKRNFPDFMTELQNIKGGLPDIRIGVVSSNFGAGPGMPAPECPVYGDRGAFLVRPSCGLDSAKKGFWLTVDGKGNKNFDGELPNVFSCMASLGTMGCGYEHQLQSLRASLAASDPMSSISPQNRGFLRKDAFLGIVILSDEDDCSGEPGATFFQDPVPGQAGSLRCALLGHTCNGQPVPPNKDFRSTFGACKPYERTATEINSRLINVKEFVDYVKAIKGGNEDKIIVSSIIGWTPNNDTAYGLVERPSQFGGTELDLAPVCSDMQTGSAAPGLRLLQFTKSFRNNTVHTICQADLKEAMKQIGEKFALVIENTCITTPLVDTDLDKPGVQPDCQVRDRIPRDDGVGYVENPLPNCAFGGSPCWELTPDMACGSGYRTTVRRPNNSPPPPNTLQVVNCLACTEGVDPRRCPPM
jgi:hypothetical protein